MTPDLASELVLGQPGRDPSLAQQGAELLEPRELGGCGSATRRPLADYDPRLSSISGRRCVGSSVSPSNTDRLLKATTAPRSSRWHQRSAPLRPQAGVPLWRLRRSQRMGLSHPPDPHRGRPRVNGQSPEGARSARRPPAPAR
jgi:hypothetical protein